MKFFFRVTSYCSSKITALIFKLWLAYVKLKYPKLNLGKNIVIRGFPIFEIHGSAEIKCNNTFVSSTKYNPVGISKTCNIYVSPEGELTLGNGGGYSGVSIVCWEKIVIGDYCGFGGNVSIWDTDFHGLHYKERTEKHAVKTAPIVIGDNVWVGANCLILKGVNIGDRSVIGAGSVVTKNIPSDEVWAGNPAHFIKKIDNPKL
jgi:NDP-sugar pyrophosphorylase family protein